MSTKDIGNAAYLNRQLKMRGLQKLRFYCQICRKQCRDENGFRSHCKSSYHQKRLSQTSEKDLDDYSTLFEANFLRLLRLSHGEKKVEANKFYNEYIQDKEHIHMNATRFTSLTKFIQYLSKDGKIKVHDVEKVLDEMDTGRLLISYVDNSSNNIIRKKELEAHEENQKSEDDIKLKILDRQIAKCRSESSVEKSPLSENVSTGNPKSINGINISISKVTKKKPRRSLNNIFKNKK